MNFKAADECEHARMLPEPEEFEIILGLRRLVQQYQHTCGLDYNAIDCPLTARMCCMKLECDHNGADLAAIGMIELGTNDINLILDNNEVDDCEESDEDWEHP